MSTRVLHSFALLRSQSKALLRWAISALPRSVAVPEIGLLAADYDAGVATGEARAILHFSATVARARLAAARMEKLVCVTSARLIAAPG